MSGLELERALLPCVLLSVCFFPVVSFVTRMLCLILM